MDIPISFKIYLIWKNLFNKKEDIHQIKISKEGKGVRSILFFLPEKIQDAKIANYLVKVENPLPGYDIGLVCSEKSKIFYPHIDNVKLFTFNDEDLNYFNTIKSLSLMNQISSKSYDAIVDLNTGFCAATAMLAFELNAPLKIGFDSVVNRKIFTITLERKENTFLESYFSRILSLLGAKL
tara:strand:+ start:1503 stop:2045 length:543 start_codon:yes stop_codon:yes gene_type:complete